jgi:hypothetical protein
MKTSVKPAVVVTSDTHRPISPDAVIDEQLNGGYKETPDIGLRQLDLLARWMDSAFQLPGTKIRFGFDALIGLIPGLGDTATSLVSLYILHVASQRGVSRLTMARMAANIMVDFVIGSIPAVGDLFDVYWKSNQMNVELLRQHRLADPAAARRLRTSDWLFLAGLSVLLIILLVGSLTISYFVVRWIANRISA